jgi:hypothetical protein
MPVCLSVYVPPTGTRLPAPPASPLLARAGASDAALIGGQHHRAAAAAAAAAAAQQPGCERLDQALARHPRSQPVHQHHHRHRRPPPHRPAAAAAAAVVVAGSAALGAATSWALIS